MNNGVEFTEPAVADVGVVALAHAQTPVSAPVLDIIRAGVTGELDLVIPAPAIIGAHHVLTGVFGATDRDAARVLRNLLTAHNIRLYDDTSRPNLDSALENVETHNVDGWDGYYIRAYRQLNGGSLLTTDDDFASIGDVNDEIILTEEEFRELNTYLEGV